MATMDLGLSLVDNPVAGGAHELGEDGAHGPELGTLPDQLRRVGDLLSQTIPSRS